MFLGPLLSIATIWVAIDYGLGLRASQGTAFGLRLISALSVWFFFLEAILNATHSIVGNTHLVKKVRFPVDLLPISSAMVAFAVHIVVIGIVMIIVLSQLGQVSFAILTLPVWLALNFLIAVGFCFILASLNVFFPNVGVMLPALAGLWFWLTPIVWPLTRIPEDWRWIAMLNPITVVVEGYWYALSGAPLLYGVAITAVIAVVWVAMVVAMAFVFFRLRPHFADVL